MSMQSSFNRPGHPHFNDRSPSSPNLPKLQWFSPDRERPCFILHGLVQNANQLEAQSVVSSCNRFRNRRVVNIVKKSEES